MERFDLDLRLAVFEGARPSIGELAVYARLRAEPPGPSARPAEYLVLCRDESARLPSSISQSEVTDQDVVRLVKLLGAAGFPGRRPRVVPNASLLGNGHYVALEARMQGQAASMELTLEQAGFSGDDAEPLRAVLRRLAELTPAGRRPPVMGVVERLVIERKPAVYPGPAGDGGAVREMIRRRPSAEDLFAGAADRHGERRLHGHVFVGRPGGPLRAESRGATIRAAAAIVRADPAATRRSRPRPAASQPWPNRLHDQTTWPMITWACASNSTGIRG